jgi:hypothetical protein
MVARRRGTALGLRRSHNPDSGPAAAELQCVIGGKCACEKPPTFDCPHPVVQAGARPSDKYGRRGGLAWEVLRPQARSGPRRPNADPVRKSNSVHLVLLILPVHSLREKKKRLVCRVVQLTPDSHRICRAGMVHLPQRGIPVCRENASRNFASAGLDSGGFRDTGNSERIEIPSGGLGHGKIPNLTSRYLFPTGSEHFAVR